MTTTEEIPAKPTLDDVSRSLTGYDEIAIENVFRRSITDLSGTLQSRALLFTLKRRSGMRDTEAFKDAMSMVLGEVQAQFAEPELDDEGDPGKDESGSTQLSS